MLNKNIFFNEYKRKRRKWIVISGCVAVAVTALAIVSFALFFRFKSNESASYKEIGNAEYSVSLKENDFYASGNVSGKDAYVADLIDEVKVDFTYDLDVNARKSQGKYSYRVDTYLEVRDNKTGAVLLEDRREPASERTGEIKGGILNLSQSVSTDYSQYDKTAREFVSRYGLLDTESRLVLKMSVDITELSGSFEWNDAGEYVIEVCLPLCQSTVRPTVETSVPSEPRVVQERGGAAGAALVFALLFAAIDVAAISLTVSLASLTDEKSEYERKMRRLCADYKGYIKKVRNEFDTVGYKVVLMDSLEDLIDMRDGENSSVLMYESENGEYSRFFILMPPNLMYAFDISSDASGKSTVSGRVQLSYGGEKGKSRGERFKLRLMRFLND